MRVCEPAAIQTWQNRRTFLGLAMRGQKAAGTLIQRTGAATQPALRACYVVLVRGLFADFAAATLLAASLSAVTIGGSFLLEARSLQFEVVREG